jgi:hypothetical protein
VSLIIEESLTSKEVEKEGTQEKERASLPTGRTRSTSLREAGAEAQETAAPVAGEDDFKD